MLIKRPAASLVTLKHGPGEHEDAACLSFLTRVSDFSPRPLSLHIVASDRKWVGAATVAAAAAATACREGEMCLTRRRVLL